MAKSARPSPDPLGLNAFRQPVDGGLSLNELSAAFAEMLQSGADPYDPAPESHAADAPETSEPSAAGALSFDALAMSDTEPSEADATADSCELSPRSILEAMLFVGHPSNEPLAAETVAGLMRGVRASEIDDLVRELNQRYLANGCPYEIVGEGAGYRLSTRPQYARLRDKIHGRIRLTRLSTAAVEVLSLVAYRGPISADDVSRLRGMPCGALLNQLVRRELLTIERATPESRTVVYRTSERFLRLFGLASLEELPRSQDLESP